MARTGPVDPDVDLHDPAQRQARCLDPLVLAVIAAGGVAGSEARYALGLALPHGPGGWPLATFLINVSGSFVLGALMVVLTELTSPHRLLRPFLGVGVLGGWTTFSTAMVDGVALLRADRPVLGLVSLAGTALAALLAAAAGASIARLAGTARRRSRSQGAPR
jgi:CrcB protein